MDDRKWQTLPDGAFEELLQGSLPETLPDDVIHAITPWRQAVERILWGMALTAVTLNFWGLNYILPFAGVILSLLGFRTLRGENGWFRACWLTAAVRVILVAGNLIVDATIWQGQLSGILMGMTAVSVLLLFVQFFCLWRGLGAVQKKMELDCGSAVAGWLVVWYCVLCLLALVRFNGLLLPIVMLAVYGLILRSLWRLSGQLEEAGYGVSTTKVRVPDWLVAAAVTVLTAVGILLGLFLFGRYSMAWSPRADDYVAEAAEVRQELLDLGFPEVVLADLTEAELLSCRGALRVITDETELPIDRGREEVRQEGSLYHYYNVYEEYVRIIGVGVELPGTRERWRVFHHFEYLDGTTFYGTECAQLWPAYVMNQGWSGGSDVTGRLLYDDGGITCTAPFVSLSGEAYTTNSIFWGESTQRAVFAEFSMPNHGSRHRGYLTYEILENTDGYLVDAWINLTHQTTRLQYPVLTAKEKRTAYSGTSSGAFRTVQDALQFSPAYIQMDGKFTVVGSGK